MSLCVLRLLAVTLLLGGAAAAQRPVQGLLLSPEARPLADAAVSFHPAPRSALPWIAEHEPPRAAVRGRSNGLGEYTLAVEARSGCLLATHHSGLGAVISAAAPGVPERVVMRPMGEVTIEGITGSLTTHVAVILRDGSARYLGRWTDRRLLLPPGDYRLLASSGDRTGQYTCRVEEGREHTLPAPAEVRALALSDADCDVSPAGWPGITLARRTSDVVIERQPQVLRVTRRHRADLTFTEVWVRPDTSALTLPPAPRWGRVRVTHGDDHPVRGARVYTVSTTPAGPRVTALSETGDDGRARHALQPGSSFIVTEAPGFGLELTDANEAGELRIQLERGVHAQVAVELGGQVGQDARGVSVELRYDSNPWCIFAGRTDARGRARFTELPRGEATLSVSSDRHPPAARRVAVTADDASWRVRLDPGASLAGRVELDGRPIQGAVVRLRDPSGHLRRPRVVVTDVDGRFSFDGLPPEALLTLSAEVQRAGSTWSGQVRAVQPGGDEPVLDLRLEDPPAPHRREKGQ